MISFHYEINFEFFSEKSYKYWISKVIASESKELGEINYIFCDDSYLLKINQDYLNHDTYTDIISFDYSKGNILSGDIFISVERVRDNAQDFGVSFDEELKRVMVHGILHYCGYQDKTEADQKLMRQKENKKIKMFHVEQ